MANPADDKSLKSLTTYNKIAFLIIAFTNGVSHISELAVQYYLKDNLKVDPSSLSFISGLVHIPYVAKPLFGLITDLVPLFGYRRKIYIVLCAFLKIAVWQILYFTSPGANVSTLLFILNNLSLSFSSVLGQAILVELSQMEGNTDSAKDYISLFYFAKYSGALLAAFFKGYFLEIMSPQKVFLIASFIPILLLAAGLILKEVPRTTEADESQTRNNPSLLSEFCSFISLPEILIPMLFVIFLMSTPSYSDPFFYFLTNELKFTATALGEISICATLGTLAVILVYKNFLKQVSFRLLIFSGSITFTIMSFLALILVQRINIDFGINDFWFCLFSSSILSIIGEIIILPLLALVCFLCPKSLEATVYALFMSALSLGQVISNLSGAALTHHFGITITNYSNLSKLIIVSNIYGLLHSPFIFLVNKKYFDKGEKPALEDEQDVEGLVKKD